MLAPNEEFIGTIKSIEQNRAFIDTNDGIIEVNLSELFIKMGEKLSD